MARESGTYRDRDEAGDVLANLLERYRGHPAVVLAIPNGGVPVGVKIRAALGADFGVLVVRKLHIPWNREAGFGAVAPDGTVAFNEGVRQALGLSDAEEMAVVEAEEAEIARRIAAYGAHELPPLKGLQAILVDDGLASGYSMLAAVHFVRRRQPSKLIVAVPTASREAVHLVGRFVDALVCPNVRGGPVFAVADAYREWRDLGDDEVVNLLQTIRHEGLTR